MLVAGYETKMGLWAALGKITQREKKNIRTRKNLEYGWKYLNRLHKIEFKIIFLLLLKGGKTKTMINDESERIVFCTI